MTSPIKDLWKSLIFKRLSSSENFFEQHFFMLSPRRGGGDADLVEQKIYMSHKSSSSSIRKSEVCT